MDWCAVSQQRRAFLTIFTGSKAMKRHLIFRDEKHIPAHKKPRDVLEGCLTFEGAYTREGVELTITDSWELDNLNQTVRTHTIIKSLNLQEREALIAFLQGAGQ